jgi:hypothetical protein
MGYDPSGEAAQRYYTTGFASVVALAGAALAEAQGNGLVIAGAGSCLQAAAANQTYFLAGKLINGLVADLSHLPATAVVGSQLTEGDETFEIAAAGVISSDAAFATNTTSSLFTIDENKLITTNRAGY